MLPPFKLWQLNKPRPPLESILTPLQLKLLQLLPVISTPPLSLLLLEMLKPLPPLQSPKRLLPLPQPARQLFLLEARLMP